MLGTDGEKTPKPRAQGERWTTDQVLAVAPDEASRKAGGKLATPGPWTGTGAGDGAVWGVCKGSGSTPYRTMTDTTGPAFQCSCPSRKFPCKHALGLLLLWAGEDGAEGDDTEAAVPAGEPPRWVAEWLSGRREHREDRPGKGDKDGGKGDKGSKGLADPAAARRRAERRAQRIGAGAEELERRLADLLRSGLASADRAGYGSWDETAARMVDAQAPGLAARVRELGSIPGSGADWPSRLLEECALLHLLDEGFLGIERLPGPLAATIRSRVGLPADTSGTGEGATPDAASDATPGATREAAGEAAEEGATVGPVGGARERTVRDRWLVLAQQDREEGPQGKLTTRRIWMRGERTGRMALHLSYAGPGRTHELALPPGLVLDADLTYHPGARPLRVTLGERYAPAVPGGVPAGCGTDAALAAYGDALRDDPWLDSWPVVLADVVPIPARPPAPGRPGTGWQLADAEGESALPVDPRCAHSPGLWQLTAISGGGPVTVFGECGHRGFVPLTTWDPAPVPL